jgi:hypothetical protein
MSSDDQTQSASLVLSEDLVGETRAVVKEREKVQALLDTAEGGRDKVKPEIYEKVTADYRIQLDAIASQYAPLRARMLEELGAIRAHEVELRALLGQIRDQLDELRFRCEVGEFDKAELEEREAERKGTIDGLETKLATAEKTYGVARELIGDDVDAVLSGNVPPPRAPAAAPAPAPAPVPVEAASAPPPPAPQSPATPDALSQRTVELPADAPPLPETPRSDTRNLTQGLLTRKKPDGGKTFVIDAEGLVLGRSTSCDVLVQGATVSRRHAVITWENDSYWIEDVSSGGGLSVNGQREQKVQLKSGDEVEIGAALFEYEGP